MQRLKVMGGGKDNTFPIHTTNIPLKSSARVFITKSKNVVIFSELTTLSTDGTELKQFFSHGVLLGRTQKAQKTQTFASRYALAGIHRGSFSSHGCHGLTRFFARALLVLASGMLQSLCEKRNSLSSV